MTTLPLVTVVIPSFARIERLRNCLNALGATRYPRDRFDIVVVDDGSPEPLGPAVADLAGVLPLRVLRQHNQGPAAARNAGAAAATGDLLAFTDDDCLPDAGWLDALAAAHVAQPRALIGGKVVNALPANVFATASQDLVDYLYTYFRASAGDAPFFTSNNIACGRAAFIDAGGFDASFPLAAAEDRELGLRWRAKVGPLVYAEAAVVGHAHALDLGRFWRQHANYGRGARHLHKVLRDHGDARPKLEALRFYRGLVLYPLRRGGAQAMTKVALMALSQVAMVVGYARR